MTNGLAARRNCVTLSPSQLRSSGGGDGLGVSGHDRYAPRGGPDGRDQRERRSAGLAGDARGRGQLSVVTFRNSGKENMRKKTFTWGLFPPIIKQGRKKGNMTKVECSIMETKRSCVFPLSTSETFCS